MPERKVSSARAVVEEEPKTRSAWLSAKPAPANLETKPKKVAGNLKWSDKKQMRAGGKRGAKVTQAEAADQETIDLPTENRETKTGESRASEEAGEKGAMSDKYHVPCLISGPISLLGQSGRMF
nr:non-histone chromosomal protein HMG-14-like [Oryctolagus cuniculus]